VIRIGKRGESHRSGLRNTANIHGIDSVNSGVSGATHPSLRPKIMTDPRRDLAEDLPGVKYNMFITEANIALFYGRTDPGSHAPALRLERVITQIFNEMAYP
jgi:hypothetical protein